ncbi:hypothetical protein [Micromonospora sp. RP3T]|uniref:hypothetical protein n=1 Tax=Micromonospora sp. RP3T TaxID=2135446 RepID=UPI000D15F86E|nr:hypothetical protein [Micromonospora sp. RP3T]PTA42830.1 hypothetical protein C8054_28585 [Micromonospora sp. RP3T]
MGVPDTSRQVFAQIESARKGIFEPQLAALGLSAESIRDQTVEQLEESLETINQLIANPSAVGKTSVKVGARGEVVIAAPTEGQVEIGPLPLLLDRKARILERLKVLKPAEQLDNLRTAVESVDQQPVRERIEALLDDIQEQARNLAHQARETEASSREAAASEAIKLEQFERRAKVWQSFLERESVATIVGAIILLALTVTLVVAMFVEVTPADVLSNAFLIILGYFFGQSVGRPRSGGEPQ